jgi:hypothetical protein
MDYYLSNLLVDTWASKVCIHYLEHSVLTASNVKHRANPDHMKKRLLDTSEATLPGSGNSTGMKYQSTVKYQLVGENDLSNSKLVNQDEQMQRVKVTEQ